MNIFAFIIGRLIAEREGADDQTATRVGLLGALLPMPIGLVVAAAAGRTAATTGGSDTATGGPQKPDIKTAGDARAGIDTAFAAFVDHVRSRDAEKGDAEITDKARHVVNELWPPEADNRGKQLAKGDQREQSAS
jgi:hypothetical protein